MQAMTYRKKAARAARAPRPKEALMLLAEPVNAAGEAVVEGPVTLCAAMLPVDDVGGATGLVVTPETVTTLV